MFFSSIKHYFFECDFPLMCSKYVASLIDSDPSVAWEVQRYDGWYNNLAYHSRGAAGKADYFLLNLIYLMPSNSCLKKAYRQPTACLHCALSLSLCVCVFRLSKTKSCITVKLQ